MKFSENANYLEYMSAFADSRHELASEALEKCLNQKPRNGVREQIRLKSYCSLAPFSRLGSVQALGLKRQLATFERLFSEVQT
jgi:hypothetical protein